MLTLLLSIFDDEGGFDDASQARERYKSSCRGLAYWGKLHILDAMEITPIIWNKDRKYDRSDGIQQCWRKVDILPAYWNVDIKNDVGSASIPALDKKMSNKDCNNICHMLKMMRAKVNKRNSDTNSTVYALQG